MSDNTNRPLTPLEALQDLLQFIEELHDGQPCADCGGRHGEHFGACVFAMAREAIDAAEPPTEPQPVPTPPVANRYRVYLDRPVHLTGWVRNVEATSAREAEAIVEQKLDKGILTLDDMEWGEPQEDGSWSLLDSEAHEEEE